MKRKIVFIIFTIIFVGLSSCFAGEIKSENDISNHIYLVLDIPKTKVCVNEEVPIKVMLFSDWLDLEDISLQQKASEDLIVKRFSDKIINNTVKNGIRYVVLEYTSSLIAIMPGTYMLNPVEATAKVVMPDKETLSARALLNDNKEFYEKFTGPSGSKDIVLKTPPVVIIVSESPVIKKPKEPEKLTLIPIKMSYDRLSRYDMRFYRSNIFVFIGIIPLLSVLAAVMIKKRMQFLAANPRYAAMLRASKKAHSGLVKAESLLTHGTQADFYNAIFNVMQSYLGQRAIIPEEGVTTKVLDSMADFGLNNDLRDKIRKIFSECYMARYAPSNLDRNAMKKILEETKYVIDELNKK